MLEENKTNGQLAEAEEGINLSELLFKYLAYWPWFVASVFVCLLGCYVYLRYQAPVYQVSAAVLIKEDEKKGGAANAAPFAAMQGLGMLSMTSNFENEVEILRSRTLIKKVVSDLGLYIHVSEENFFGYDRPLYKNSPIQVYMTPEEADKLNQSVGMNLVFNPQKKMLDVKLSYIRQGQEVKVEKVFDHLPAVLPTEMGVISFLPNEALLAKDSLQQTALPEVRLKATVSNPTAVASSYVGMLSVDPTSKTTTIAQISLKTQVKQLGVDFINRLVTFYNQDANDEKNEVAQKSAEFIDERISIINRELGTTESELASFKQRSGLTDLTSDAQLALQESSRYEQQRMANATQINLVRYLNEYINNPDNANEVLPANVGYTDNNLTSVIDQYNTLIIERKRLLRTSSENNPAVVNMNTGIEAMRRTVQTTVNSVLKGLQITRDDIERQASKFEGRISNAPLQEKEFMTISRQQEIKATLYIMLLQKREENAITLAATANNGRIIEEPLAGGAPVAPRKSVFMLAALMLGLGIPVGIIFLMDLLKYKIEERADMEKLTNLPILGEVPLLSKSLNLADAITVRENENGVMEEAFRTLRTNMLFMLQPGEKVVLFTSSQPGEGKSFVSCNMAASLAFMGKKVLLIGMDIRKPRLANVFKLDPHTMGMSNYLNDPEHVNILKLIQPTLVSKNLDVMLAGAIPPNPTELVSREAFVDGINQLKEKYDYILLDTAPIGMVTDTAIIGRVADLSVYVCRSGVTPKVAFGYVNVLRDEKRLSRIATLLNGVDISDRKHTYGYGRYGYGYGYGYGYSDKKKN